MERAGLVNISISQVRWCNEWLFCYFQALRFRWDNIDQLFHQLGYSRSWEHLDHKQYPIVISASGLVDNPDAFLQQVGHLDPCLAAECIASGISSPSFAIRQEIIEHLIKNMFEIEWGDAEYRSRDCAYALSLIGDASVVPEIIDALDRISTGLDGVRHSIADILTSFGPEAAPALTRALYSYEESTRRYLVKALGKIGTKQALEAVSQLPPSIDPRTDIAIAIASIRLGDDSAKERLVSVLVQHIRDYTVWYPLADLGAPAIEVMNDAINVHAQQNQLGVPLHFAKVANIIGKPAIPSLCKILRDPDANYLLKCAAIEALSGIGDLQVVELLTELLHNAEGHPNVRIEAIRALGALKDNRATRYLVGCLEDQNAMVRAEAAKALGYIGGIEAIPALGRKLHDQERPTSYHLKVCDVVAQALVQIDLAEAHEVLIPWCAARLEDTTIAPGEQRSERDKAASILEMIATREAYTVLKEGYPERFR